MEAEISHNHLITNSDFKFSSILCHNSSAETGLSNLVDSRQRAFICEKKYFSGISGSILYKELTRCNFGSIVYQYLQDHSTCFGRFLRPSSGVLNTVVTATGSCHESG